MLLMGLHVDLCPIPKSKGFMWVVLKCLSMDKDCAFDKVAMVPGAMLSVSGLLQMFVHGQKCTTPGA